MSEEKKIKQDETEQELTEGQLEDVAGGAKQTNIQVNKTPKSLGGTSVAHEDSWKVPSGG